MAITEYYVSAAGGGAHDGTTEADAWTLSEAITANNALGAGGAAGRRYNVKGAHTARGASDTISVGGTATSPAIWRGYNSTIGDLDTGTRDAYGALDTTNFPDIGYNAGFRCTISATHVVCANLDVSGSVSGDVFRMSGGTGCIVSSRVANSSTNAAASGIYCVTGANNKIVNCDASTGASSGTAAILLETATVVAGCRVTSPGAVGIKVTQGALIAVIHNTAYGCGVAGLQTTNASAAFYAIGNTIYGCADGIDIVSTASAVTHTYAGNHITDNSGYGIDFNGGTSGAIAIVAGNRFRDNTSGNVNGYTDWAAGTNFREITTDAGGASTDYVDAATNKDFRLISTAAGYRQGFAYNANIGACGDNVSGGGGGAMVIGG